MGTERFPNGIAICEKPGVGTMREVIRGVMPASRIGAEE